MMRISSISWHAPAETDAEAEERGAFIMGLTALGARFRFLTECDGTIIGAVVQWPDKVAATQGE